MQSLRSMLQSSLFFLLLFFITGSILFFSFAFEKKSKYSTETTSITGKVLNYQVEDHKGKFTVQAQEKIIVYYELTEEELSKNWIGSQVYIEGSLVEPSVNTIWNTLNYKEYLYYHGIHYLCYANTMKIQKNPFLFSLLKNKILKYIDSIPEHAYLNAILLGNKSEIDMTEYEQNGISHLFTVSGMHFAIFIACLEKILKKNCLSNFILSIFLWFYAFLVGFTPSVLRVIIFFHAKKLNHKLHDLWTPKQLFCFIFCGFLIIHPFYIKDIGFQFSFLIPFCLLYLKEFKEKLNLLKQNGILFLASIPILGSHFYRINLCSILLNVLLIPCFSILYPLCLLIVLCPYLGFLLKIPMVLLEFLNHLIASSNFGVIVIPKVSWIYWEIYFLLFYLFLKRKKKKYIIVLIILFVWIKTIPKWDSNAYVYFLDVGQGDSAVIISPHQKDVIMIDTGGNTQDKSHYLAEELQTFLASLGISRLSGLILTHGDYDHMGEAENLLQRIKPQKVFGNCGATNELETKLIETLEKKHITYKICQKNWETSSLKLYFLNTSSYENENDNSMVVYLELYSHSFLFMGDAPSKVEEKIISKYRLPTIDFLKVGHHGSKTSSSKEFINRITPKHAILSVGKNNPYGHPNKEVLENLKNAKIYRTDKQGSILVTLNKKSFKIITAS